MKTIRRSNPNFATHLALGLTLGAILFSFTAPAQAAPAAAEAKEGKKGSVININSADTTQLSLLPRIGPSVAQRIVDYRKKNGPFKTTDDLMLVQGIGEKTFQLLKPYVAIAGETTLKEKVKGSKTGSSSKSEGKPAAAKKESR